MKIKFTLFALLFSIFLINAQTAEERAEIIKSNNQLVLQQLIVDLEAKNVKDQEKVLEYSRANNIPIFKKNDDGSFDQLMRITPEGIPLYYSIDNADAANSTRANRLHNGGALGLNIEGQGMTAYVWDGGPVLVNHNEFVSAGANRVSIGDFNTTLNGNSFHATHVSGTIGASGFDANAKGMAPQADVVTNNWDNDSAEMTNAAATGALISNHSYGIRLASFANASQLVGKYTESAQIVDRITFNAPYYLPVFSAGNDGGNDTSNSNPMFGVSNFDKLTGDKIAKNSMLVANAQDANINGDGSLNSVLINSGSSQGPTDDLRIKPDITGNGTQLFSTFDGSPSAYGTISGTSMSAPNVAGSLLLLQQYYNQRNGTFMRAATLKGLALHTADDFDIVGPDARSGWGLMNTAKAAQTIANDKLSSRIVEATLQNGQSYSITVDSEGIEDLIASLSWTDPTGQINNGPANDTTPALVNDLDIRITQNGTNFEPWKLTSPTSNTRGDNTVDNYERIDISSPIGTYVITVTHKGSLLGGSQAFSLIISGEDNNFALNSTVNTLEICNNLTDSIPVEFLSKSNFSDTVNLSVQNVPGAVTATFTNTSFTAPGNTIITFGNLTSVSDGVYPISIVATSSSETKSIDVFLRVLSANFTAVNLLSPGDQAIRVSTSTTLDWADELNAQRYQVQLSTSPSFGRPSLDRVVTSSSLIVPSSILFPSVTYYWRVMPINDCGQGTFTSRSFTTFDCDGKNRPISNPISLPDNNPVGIQSVLNINRPNNIDIGNVTVYVNITHEYSGDVLMTLTSPSGIVVQLTAPAACDLANLDVTFDDVGGPFTCDTATGLSGYTGTIQPVGNLSDFDGESVNGNWTLSVADVGPADLGALNSWRLNFCEQELTASSDDIIENSFVIYPNPSRGLFTVKGSNDLNSDDAVINVLDLNGRIVFTKKVQNASRLNETINVQDLSSGLYLLQIQQGNSRSVQKIIID